MAYRTHKEEHELDDAAIADAVATFLAIKQRDWVRRQRNRLFKIVFDQVDAARANGLKPDVRQIMEDAFLRGQLPLLEE